MYRTYMYKILLYCACTTEKRNSVRQIVLLQVRMVCGFKVCCWFTRGELLKPNVHEWYDNIIKTAKRHYNTYTHTRAMYTRGQVLPWVGR